MRGREFCGCCQSPFSIIYAAIRYSIVCDVVRNVELLGLRVITSVPSNAILHANGAI